MRQRGIGLTVWLVYLVLSNAWGAYRAITVYMDLVSHNDPRFPHWPFVVLGVLSIVAIFGAVGMWLLKRRGVVVFASCWVAGFGLNLYLGARAWTILVSLVGVAVLYFIVRYRWEDFR